MGGGQEHEPQKPLAVVLISVSHLCSSVLSLMEEGGGVDLARTSTPTPTHHIHTRREKEANNFGSLTECVSGSFLSLSFAAGVCVCPRMA